MRVHWATLLTPLAVLLLGMYRGVSPHGLLWLQLFVVAVYGCVLLHELGHAWAARRCGVRVHDILLLPVGGAARFAAMPERPSREAWVTLAGPLVNLAIALALAPALLYWPREAWFPWLNNYDLASWVVSLAAFNLAVFAFNLIPAFPLDGGRLLRAVLTNWWARRRATRYAAGVAKVIAILAVAYAVHEGSWVIGGFAGYVFVAARREERHTAVQVFLDEMTLGEIARPIWVFGVHDTVHHVLQAVERRGDAGALVTDEYCPIGFAHLRELRFVAEPEARAIGTLELHPVDLHLSCTPLREISRQFSAHPRSVAIEEIHGRPAGYVSMAVLEDAYDAFVER